jgi:hypothetical protein
MANVHVALPEAQRRALAGLEPHHRCAAARQVYGQGTVLHREVDRLDGGGLTDPDPDLCGVARGRLCRGGEGGEKPYEEGDAHQSLPVPKRGTHEARGR